MRGKKAKKTRKLAAYHPSQVETYHGIEHTVRDHKIHNLAGEVVMEYRTATYQRNPSTRTMYQMLKKAAQAAG